MAHETQPSLYKEELKTMKNLTKEEYIVILRRYVSSWKDYISDLSFALQPERENNHLESLSLGWE